MFDKLNFKNYELQQEFLGTYNDIKVLVKFDIRLEVIVLELQRSQLVSV